MQRITRLVVVLLLLFLAAGPTRAANMPTPPTLHAGPAPTNHPVAAPHHTTPQELWQIGGLIAALGAANVGIFMLAIAMNFRRSLAADFADGWEDPRYPRMLPNVLALLKRRGFNSPWPRHCNPWSMHRFERRLARAIRPLLKNRAADFVEWHLSVWIWVESHHAECSSVLHSKEVERALECLATTRIAGQREGLVAFLNSPRALTQTVLDEKTIHKLHGLRRVHVLMREHGWSVTSEFEAADTIEQTSHEDLPELLCSQSRGA